MDHNVSGTIGIVVPSSCCAPRYAKKNRVEFIAARLSTMQRCTWDWGRGWAKGRGPDSRISTQGQDGVSTKLDLLLSY